MSCCVKRCRLPSEVMQEISGITLGFCSEHWETWCNDNDLETNKGRLTRVIGEPVLLP